MEWSNFVYSYLLCCKLKAFYTSSRRNHAPCKCSSEISICQNTIKTRKKPNESALDFILVKHWITSTKLHILVKNYFSQYCSKLFFQKCAFKSLLINKRRTGVRQWQMNLRLLYQCLRRRHVVYTFWRCAWWVIHLFKLCVIKI